MFRASVVNYDLDSDFYLYYMNTKESMKEELKIIRNNNYHKKKIIMNMNL